MTVTTTTVERSSRRDGAPWYTVWGHYADELGFPHSTMVGGSTSLSRAHAMARRWLRRRVAR